MFAALLAAATLHAVATPAAYTVGPIDWTSAPLTVTSTASTVEVDVMPFLSRRTDIQRGKCGPFPKYYEALSNLGAEYVRFAPWCPYPRVTVTELTPPDCTATKPATNWNSTLMDMITADFMAAVCGANAVQGGCKHSVYQQLSTMPSWLYKLGFPAAELDPDPWKWAGGNYKFYEQGEFLHDETCIPMAQYVARLVGHYTAGGQSAVSTPEVV